MDKNMVVDKAQETIDVSAIQDLSELQLALVGGGIGETIL